MKKRIISVAPKENSLEIVYEVTLNLQDIICILHSGIKDWRNRYCIMINN